MKSAIVLFTGVMIASAGLAGQNDSSAEERYRMKYGRYTPAQEARRAAADQKVTDANGHVGQSCCRHMKHESSVEETGPNSPVMESWFRMKFGRSTPGAEARQRVADEQLAMHVRKCAELDRRPLVAAQKPTANTNVAAANVSDSETWFRAKYGRSTPGEERRAAMAVTDERPVVASANPVSCEMECCKHGE